MSFQTYQMLSLGLMQGWWVWVAKQSQGSATEASPAFKNGLFL
jgi:hypothetical protein